MIPRCLSLSIGRPPARRRASTPTRASTLKRELGRWDLTAIGVNQVIGSGVFALPAALAASAGAWSPWMVAAVGVASMLIALSFAEVASRFEGTGGPYLYTRAAFGRFAAFEVGWMLWFTRAASWAAVINVLVAALGRYWPRVTSGAPKIVLLTSIVAVLAAINIRGIRQSSFVVNTLTVGKLAPLVIFIGAGLLYVDWSRLSAGTDVSLASLSASGLLLVFAFGGYEVVPVVAGETRDPRRDVPFALIMTIVVVTIVMTLAQIVALGTLPGLAQSKTPLADSAALFLGGAGAAMLTLGAVFSTSGNNMGQALSGSRNLFALAEQGDLPPFFGRVHRDLPDAGQRDPRHRRGGARARGVRDLPGAGGGERDQPARGLRRDVRLDAAPAPDARRQPAGVHGSVRSGDPRRGDRLCAGDPGRGQPPAVVVRDGSARGRRRAVLDCRQRKTDT